MPLLLTATVGLFLVGGAVLLRVHFFAACVWLAILLAAFAGLSGIGGLGESRGGHNEREGGDENLHEADLLEFARLSCIGPNGASILRLAKHQAGPSLERMSKPVLFDYFRSSASYRVRIALNLKGIDYEARPVNLLESAHKDEAYRALNPQGFVPMLEMEGLRLTQSLAIIDYLEARVPEPRLVPTDPAERAHVLALALTIACDIHPVNNLRILKYLAGPLEQPQEVRDDWYRHWIREGFVALEALAKEKAGRFLFGDTLSLADVCLVPQMFNARRFNVDLDAFPTLVAADAEASRLEAFAAAHPDRVAPQG